MLDQVCRRVNGGTLQLHAVDQEPAAAMRPAGGFTRQLKYVRMHTWAVPCGVVTFSSSVLASKCSPVGLA
jgi:hypothetical protein